MSRSGATMGVLSNKSSHPGESSHIILVGGFHLPKPDQVSDSNIFILKYPDMVWKKLPFQENMVWKKFPFQKNMQNNGIHYAMQVKKVMLLA